MSLPVDPHLEREKEKYESPVASRELILEVLGESAGPMKRRQLEAVFKIIDDEDRKEGLRRRLRAMERDGQVVRNRRNAYLPVSEASLITGRVIAHPDGFGFLVPDEGGDDLFMSPKQMQSLLHGDRAVIRVAGVDRRGRREGALVEVIERAHDEIVGRLFIEHGVGFVVPDNKRIHQDIMIPPDDLGEAEDGQIVVASIMEQPNKHTQPIGRIIKVMGEHMAPGMEIDIALRSHDLPHEWPSSVEDEISGLDDTVPEAAKAGRLDLRNTPLVTIDGADARDFDDAVYCERSNHGWRLLVAIADVSSYVRIWTALDTEALQRGTSVYFPNNVIPMLPEVLSNGLCSINPQVDRLCMVCEMHLDDAGKLNSYQFHEGLMRSHARLTYDQVAAMLVDQEASLREEFAAVLPHLEDLHALYDVLRKAREARGAIDFETSETYFEFDDDRKIQNVVPLERNVAHKMIEECMIAANVTAAKFLKKHQIVSLHRNHEGPSLEKIQDLRQFLGEFGLHLGGGDKPTPKDYGEVLSGIQDRPDKHLIQTVMLRSLSQAVYSPDEDIGHFGLAQEDYAHFTSPIRRYPDLLVHRAIRHILQGGKARGFSYSEAEMAKLGEHCSMCERRADEATRDVDDWLKCEFMLDKVGEHYSGTVSSATSFGLFVELDGVFVEGLVHITALPSDYYHYEPAGHRLVGKRSGRTFRLGDRVDVIVARVDLDERKIDFELQAPVEEEKKKKKRSKK
ncbi:MAG TPA: ribonuclease R [Gammaproteobacteria bacterium]|nr:ribonuclease R [Gammaproteobacteria bacterium]